MVLYSCCIHVATVGVKGLKYWRRNAFRCH